MAISVKISTGLRNHIATVGSAMAALQNGFIDIYPAPEPASADDDVSAYSRLVRISLDSTGTGLPLVALGVGGFGKSGSDIWSGVCANSGEAAWFRHVAPSDNGTSSPIAPRIQGNVALAEAALTLTGLVLGAGTTQTLDTYAATVPVSNL